MIRVHEDRHLVGTESAFYRKAVDDFRPCPALGRPKDDHGPAGPGVVLLAPGVFLDSPDLPDGLLQGSRHELMHGFRIVPFHEVGRPSATRQELFQFLVFDARQQGGIADLVTVQVEDRQHRPIGDRIEELVGMPGRGQGAGFRLTIPDDTGDDQIRVVKRGAEGVAERIAQFPPSWIDPGVVGAT